MHLFISIHTSEIATESLLNSFEDNKTVAKIFLNFYLSINYFFVGIGVLNGALNLTAVSELRSQKLFTEDFVYVVRSDHPLTKTKLTIESFQAGEHALITIRNSPISYIDSELKQLGVKRQVMLKLPHFLADPLIIAESDLILTLPRRVGQMFASYRSLSLLELPLSLNHYDYVQVWHKRHDTDPRHIWLRELIASQTQQL